MLLVYVCVCVKGSKMNHHGIVHAMYTHGGGQEVMTSEYC